MHKLADHQDDKDAAAVSDKVYTDIEELKKATHRIPRREKVSLDYMI